MTANPLDSTAILQRMVDAVEEVRQRLLRASAALGAADIEYAVVGGNAVAAWVATIDQAAVRNTQDVDILIRRTDFDAAKQALEAAGFTYSHVAGLDTFLDSPGASPRQAVHLVFAGEQGRANEPATTPDMLPSTDLGQFRVLDLHGLLTIKLTAFRDKDRTHIRDLIGVGLVDETWPGRFQPELAERLQSILDTPDG